ncbi:raffinose/stachyose/melibiose transport system permease protein [Micromonospora nigra]|uniref:Raffinose/stachyose/melibiose transport system permease protein n=1 Tax=Micromonospora nigra TaxID=145857 RepID=A0A1C6SPS7_9ACTN|nr:sugar ABC transporter permease [Micromonospora nigra]SCL31574.1 raffinose/stachyose/melibiose transport system permease protein [Micromonospora nigra]
MSMSPAAGLRHDAPTSRPPTAAPAIPPTRGRRGGLSRLGTIAIFLAPALVLFLLLVIAPIVIAGYASVFRWNGFGLPEEFIGLDNFTRAFGDPVFRGDLWRGAVLIGLSLVIQLPVSLGLAMLLNQPLRGRSLYRVVFFAPYVLSEVTTAVLFTLVLSPNRGLGDTLSGWLGVDVGGAVFADPDTVLFALFLVVSWKYFGFHMILYLSGRQNIPQELTEAATTDGASTWQVFRYVTLPLLGPTIRISVFLSVIGTIQLFDMVWVLTGGGPIHASETMAVTMYQYGFRRFEVGYASAISIVMFLLSLVFALLYQRFVMRRDVEGAITTRGVQR